MADPGTSPAVPAAGRAFPGARRLRLGNRPHDPGRGGSQILPFVAESSRIRAPEKIQVPGTPRTPDPRSCGSPARSRRFGTRPGSKRGAGEDGGAPARNPLHGPHDIAGHRVDAAGPAPSPDSVFVLPGGGGCPPEDRRGDAGWRLRGRVGGGNRQESRRPPEYRSFDSAVSIFNKAHRKPRGDPSDQGENPEAEGRRGQRGADGGGGGHLPAVRGSRAFPCGAFDDPGNRIRGTGVYPATFRASPKKGGGGKSVVRASPEDGDVCASS